MTLFIIKNNNYQYNIPSFYYGEYKWQKYILFIIYHSVFFRIIIPFKMMVIMNIKY